MLCGYVPFFLVTVKVMESSTCFTHYWPVLTLQCLMGVRNLYDKIRAVNRDMALGSGEINN